MPGRPNGYWAKYMYSWIPLIQTLLSGYSEFVAVLNKTSFPMGLPFSHSLSASSKSRYFDWLFFVSPRVQNSAIQHTLSTKVSACMYSIPLYRDAWRMYDVHKLWTIALDHLVLVSAKHWTMPMWEALKLGRTGVIINADLWKYLRRKQPALILVSVVIA